MPLPAYKSGPCGCLEVAPKMLINRFLSLKPVLAVAHSDILVKGLAVALSDILVMRSWLWTTATFLLCGPDCGPQRHSCYGVLAVAPQ